jgi:hypothetical protein
MIYSGSQIFLSLDICMSPYCPENDLARRVIEAVPQLAIINFVFVLDKVS